MNFIIRELDLADNRSIDLFHDFYDTVFVSNFPKDEIGSFEDYLAIKKTENSEYSYHLTFIEDGGRYVACFIYCLFPAIGSMVGEFACVDKPFRRTGMASALMRRAAATHGCRWMFGEIEKKNAFNLRTWRRYGFKLVPVDYVQLSLGEGREPVRDLFLCVMPLLGQKTIGAEEVRTFIYDYYRWS